MSYCDAQRRSDTAAGRPGCPVAIASGSQFENAIMTSESDKVIVL